MYNDTLNFAKYVGANMPQGLIILQIKWWKIMRIDKHKRSVQIVWNTAAVWLMLYLMQTINRTVIIPFSYPLFLSWKRGHIIQVRQDKNIIKSTENSMEYKSAIT